MQSLIRSSSKVAKILLLALFLALAQAALASNTWYVDGVNGNDSNDCLSSQTACQTIGHAISLCSPGDTVMVAPAIYTENLQIKYSVKIVGSDAATTIVDGNQAGQVFTIINAKAHVYLSNLTIRNGSASGIYNSGTLTISKSIITGNAAFYQGGGIYNDMHSMLTIIRSTISGNVASDGGGIYNFYATLRINNSTVSENRATSYVGGIFDEHGTTTIYNTTISENSQKYDGVILNRDGMETLNNTTIRGNHNRFGGSISTSGDAVTTLQNSIIANSGMGGNCSVGHIISKGYNLSDDDTCNFSGTGDMNNTDPKLGKLNNNGGPTQTIRLLKGSPAIDAGNPNGCTDDKGNLLKTDQRGWRRPGKFDSSGRCDIGAFEVQHD